MFFLDANPIMESLPIMGCCWRRSRRLLFCDHHQQQEASFFLYCWWRAGCLFLAGRPPLLKILSSTQRRKVATLFALSFCCCAEPGYSFFSLYTPFRVYVFPCLRIGRRLLPFIPKAQEELHFLFLNIKESHPKLKDDIRPLTRTRVNHINQIIHAF